MLRCLPRATPFPYTTLFRSLPRLVREPAQREQRDLVLRGRPVEHVDEQEGDADEERIERVLRHQRPRVDHRRDGDGEHRREDRKSTRLNSSHLGISYAVFCLNASLPPPSYTLSLHDALPISASSRTRARTARAARSGSSRSAGRARGRAGGRRRRRADRTRSPSSASPCRPSTGWRRRAPPRRSEEHTSELQSLRHLVCRLLLECFAASPELHPFPTRRSSDLCLVSYASPHSASSAIWFFAVGRSSTWTSRRATQTKSG